jgi:excisionase family DNA binding protein
LLPALVFGAVRSKGGNAPTGQGSRRPIPLERAYGGSDQTALLTVRETARLLGVCLASAYAMVERGELVHLRIGNAIRVVVRRPA